MRALWLILGCGVGSLFGPLGFFIGGGIGYYFASISPADSGAGFYSGSSLFGSSFDSHRSSLTDISTGNGIHDSGSDNNSISSPSVINPATGLPMVGGIGGIDVGGSPFGTDTHDSFGSGIDDSMSSSFGDSFGSSSFDDDW